jgi:hypothetical protein
MTRLESLPNEILYFIFEYFCITDILRTFSNLNSRFTALLSAYADYKVDFRSVSKHDYDYVCSQVNPSHVQTLYLSNRRDTHGQIQHFFNIFPLNSFTSRLRSLSLRSCTETELKQIVDHLPLLTKLTVFSFVATSSTEISSDSRNQLVLALIQLPSLQQCTLTFYEDGLVFNHTSGLVFRSLEYAYLHISSLDQMIDFCRHAPNLKRLTIDAVYDEPLTIEDCSSLSNLTHLSIRTGANMEELDRMLTKAQSLVSLTLVCSNFECNNGQRWQQLLSKLHLSQFRFLFYTDPNPAMDSIIDPFREKFWLTHGWYVRYEQQTENGYINLYTAPFPIFTFQLQESNTYTVATTTGIDAYDAFKRIRELEYIGSETDVPINSNYLFPNIDKLFLINDKLPSSKIVCFDHVTKLELNTPLTHDMLNEVSMPALKRLILAVLPETWIVPCLNRRIQYLKLRQMIGLTDEDIEAMCASTSFAITCKHLSVPIRTRQSVCVLLNRLTYLTSVDIRCCSTISITDLDITDDWIRDGTNLHNFLLTIDRENDRVGLWIGRSTT